MRYIEVVGGIGIHRMDCELTDEVLHSIGEFTRENITKWLERWGVPGDFPIEDFHAVCDDCDIGTVARKNGLNLPDVLDAINQAAFGREAGTEEHGSNTIS